MRAKKFLTFIIVNCFLFTFLNYNVFADNNINVIIDGKTVEWTNSSGKPFIDLANRTQVPFRQTLEAFGADVTWDSKTMTAIATKNNITVEVPIGQEYIFRNGEKLKNDTSAIIKNNRTYLPIRAVLEAFGMHVRWDNSNQTVFVEEKILEDFTDENKKENIKENIKEINPTQNNSVKIKIAALDKKAEFITLINNENYDVELTGWTIVSVRGNQRFTFPTYTLTAGSKVIVGDSGRNNVDFHWLDGKGVWNDSKSDPAELYDNNRNLIDRY